VNGLQVNGLLGTGPLVRLAIRRDRVLLPSWIAVFVLTAASSASATLGLFPTVESRVQAAAANNSTTALVALYGRVYDPTSLGSVGMVKMGGLGAVLVAVLAMILVVRHTRAEEESGRLELVGATAVGRSAPLAAAMTVAAGANLLLGLLTAAGLVQSGLPAAGSLAFGLSWAGVGIAFAAIAAVTAQLAGTARGATSAAAAVLGAVYLLRAIGDTAGEGGPRWLSWLSPIGWSQQFRPYAGNRWWVLLVTLAFAAALTAAAFALAARRDLGASLLPDRAAAPPGLRSPLALAWRLNRGALLGWAAAFLLAGVVFGSIASSVGDLLDSPQARDFITKLGGEKGLTDAYLAAELAIVGVLAAAFGVQAAMRLRAEETGLRAEPVLATAVTRTSWLASHLTVALAGTAVLMTAAGVGAGLTHALQSRHFGEFGRVLGAALVQLPAAWLVTAIVVAAFGLVPRATAVGWVALVAFLLLGEFGPLLGLNQVLIDLSPFAHVPRLPGAPLTVLPLVILLAVAAGLVLLGVAGFRRRDVGT
jgi:ABC-2 type transport system permease protein